VLGFVDAQKLIPRVLVVRQQCDLGSHLSRNSQKIIVGRNSCAKVILDHVCGRIAYVATISLDENSTRMDQDAEQITQACEIIIFFCGKRLNR
jgi:hypothetical protein